MTLRLVPVLCLLATACSATRAPSRPSTVTAAAPVTGAPSVAGRTYEGPPHASPCHAEFEGACETGSITFDADGGASWVPPGSDIIETGRYTQSGAQIALSTRHGQGARFTLEDDGRALVDASSHTRYRVRDAAAR